MRGKGPLEDSICEPCLDILPNWRDMQSKFGSMTLSAIQCTKMQTVRDWQNKAVVLNETEVNN